MAATGAIRFQARLQRPRAPRGAAWAFLVLPPAASARLPSRSQVSVAGEVAGTPLQATLQPDGQGGHWLKLERRLLAAAGVQPGDLVALSITPLAQEPEPRLPADLRKALAAQPQARATWDDITARARRDWIHWITSGKQAATRAKRLATACVMLASGKRRACCFDRSGMYSAGNMGVPEAAEPDAGGR